uniref:Ubiquitin-like domain-containing protein n=1 Tax=Monodelphis domestica TaxID=13616 RepID=A0A5F8H458_MONDO
GAARGRDADSFSVLRKLARGLPWAGFCLLGVGGGGWTICDPEPRREGQPNPRLETCPLHLFPQPSRPSPLGFLSPLPIGGGSSWGTGKASTRLWSHPDPHRVVSDSGSRGGAGEEGQELALEPPRGVNSPGRQLSVSLGWRRTLRLPWLNRPLCVPPRLARVAVLHGCVGSRTYEVPPPTTVGEVKELIYRETDFPASEQQLWHRGRELSDWIKIGDLLTYKSCDLFLNLQSKGLKGGGIYIYIYI